MDEDILKALIKIKIVEQEIAVALDEIAEAREILDDKVRKGWLSEEPGE